jgi:hypothetical protein
MYVCMYVCLYKYIFIYIRVCISNHQFQDGLNGKEDLGKPYVLMYRCVFVWIERYKCIYVYI